MRWALLLRWQEQNNCSAVSFLRSSRLERRRAGRRDVEELEQEWCDLNANKRLRARREKREKRTIKSSPIAGMILLSSPVRTETPSCRARAHV